MIFSHSGADRSAAQPERGLLLRMVVCFCLLALSAGGATAGFGPEIQRVREGGGTWGDILEMSAVVRSPSILFIVRKKNGLPFHTDSDISIRTGSYNGPAAASGLVPNDSSAVSLSVRQDRLGAGQSYYAYLFNSYGHAWVGPLKLGSFDAPDNVVYPTTRVSDSAYPLERRDGPSKPRIENLPAVVPVNERVLISVRAGACPDGGKVRVQCFAEGEGRSNQYESERVWSGSLLQVPFRFDQPGEQSIFCATISRCCSSPWVSGTVNVQKQPIISKAPSRSETKINISVVTDADGRADSKVSVQSSRTADCAPFCGGEISYDRPYLPEAEEPSYAVPYDTPPDGTYVLPDAVPDL
ncbi:MAG: hypothetical protein ACTFAL_16465 [Candidatus Electronema sp. V4]|uniref:hypothetical protein n=1 Tax=Candidatus Electronema sp. V4 TaxID=3454756 RepID=UPI0040555B07